MSEAPLICKNDQCRGRDFEHAGGNRWKCVYCGTITSLATVKNKKKKIRPVKDEGVQEVKYTPITYICELCGAKIGTIEHPREQKVLNETWEMHTCNDRSELRYI